MRKLLLVSMLAVFGCTHSRDEVSDELTEPATVVDTVYMPSSHGSGVSPTVDLTGKGGMGLAFTSVDIPEQYAIVFKCQHGKFIIHNQEKAKRLFQLLNRDEKVVVHYRERYRATYQDEYDEKHLIERHLVKYDFIDAIPQRPMSGADRKE